MVPIPFHCVQRTLCEHRWFLTDKSFSSCIGWLGNEYSLVGKNPVGLIDPWGLSPISAENLKEL